MTRTLAEVMSELNALPDPDDVANFLRSKGVKGERGQQCTCPIAQYVIRETGATRAEVSSSYTTAVFLDIESGTRIEQLDSVDHELSVEEFVEYFDNDGYPELDSEENTNAA